MHKTSCALRDLSADLPGYTQMLRGILVELLTPVRGVYPWKSFTWKTATDTRSGAYATFPEYLRAWSRFTLEDVQRLFSADVVVCNLLDVALTTPVGGDRTTKAGPARKSGNSKEATLRKLRKHAPDLHKQVLKGELSPHKAAVKAGMRPAMWSAPQDADKLAAALDRRYPGVFTRR